MSSQPACTQTLCFFFTVVINLLHVSDYFPLLTMCKNSENVTNVCGYLQKHFVTQIFQDLNKKHLSITMSDDYLRFIKCTLLVFGWSACCVQNSFSYLWHIFNKVLEIFTHSHCAHKAVDIVSNNTQVRCGI